MRFARKWWWNDSWIYKVILKFEKYYYEVKGDKYENRL
jgi:hypothetical protein